MVRHGAGKWESVIVFFADGFLKNRFDKLRDKVPQYQLQGFNWVARDKRPFFLNYVRFLLAIPRMFFTVRKIIHICRKHRIDVVHTNCITQLEGALAAWWLGKPHFWQIRELIDLDYYQYLWSKKFVCRVVSRLSDGIICNSLRTKEAIQGFGIPESKLRLAYNITEKVENTADITELDESLQDHKIVCYVGWITPNKRVEDFVALVDRLSDQKVKFLIIGDWGGIESYNEKVRYQIQQLKCPSSLVITGAISNAAQYLSSVDLLVCPCYTESFGRTVAEALAAATPAIGVRNCAVAEIIDDGQSGYLYESGNVDQLEKQVKSLLAEPEALEEYGRFGQQQVLEKFGPETVTAELAAIYSESKGEKDE